ncbi:MAG: CinA family protein [Planctomycetales bacterium]|nr:CinA family protein [Planctomycetales bacterium]
MRTKGETSMFSDEIHADAETLLALCRLRGLHIVSAESCTGGLIAGALTEIPGSSLVVDRGFVVYSNQAKQQELAVPADLINQHGAVSEQVARTMASGALEHLGAAPAISIAVTGVAGPGGTKEKPEGLVHMAIAHSPSRQTLHECHEFGAIGRSSVRRATVLAALRLAIKCLENAP